MVHKEALRAPCAYCFNIELIVMEATGKLEALCADMLMDEDYKVAVVNPALTDMIDAEVIARYGDVNKLLPSNQITQAERSERFGCLFEEGYNVIPRCHSWG